MTAALCALAAAVLARVMPARGRHTRHPAPQDPPTPPGWEDTGHELTELDVKPARVRPYVDRRDPPEMLP